MKKIFIMLISLVSTGLLQAQILNIEKYILDRDTTRKMLGNITGSFVMYNRSAAENEPVEFLGINFKSSIAIFPGKHRIASITDINYLRLNDEPFTNTGYQHFRFELFKHLRTNPEAFAQYQYDNFRRLDPRLLAGGGIRHRLLRNNKITLTLGTGVMYESERWTHPYAEEIIQANFWKSTNYVIFRISLSEWADFNSIQYYQTAYDPSINAFRNRFSTDMNLNTTIAKRLLWTVSFTLNYEDRPIIPITKTIYRFSNGITFKF
ncbi:MAG: DUF481 domain-containing protein [Cyclobacteriaceae bacterium]|jgi:hypothetical protein|nr:DUF481 domain-containing protein [Cyclobacteriaceae bacterium]